MTDPVTHMCWSEQISPLAHSSQATWQAFNLSHCIEMHNTHPLGHAGQLSHTFGSDFDSARSAFDCQQTMAAIARVPYGMSRHTRFNTSRKMESAAMHGLFLGTNTVYRSIWPSIRIRFSVPFMSKMSKSELCEMLFANLSPRSSLQLCWNMAVHAQIYFCFLSSRDVVWLISTQNPSMLPYATCDLTVLLYNH